MCPPTPTPRTNKKLRAQPLKPTDCWDPDQHTHTLAHTHSATLPDSLDVNSGTSWQTTRCANTLMYSAVTLIHTHIQDTHIYRQHAVASLDVGTKELHVAAYSPPCSPLLRSGSHFPSVAWLCLRGSSPSDLETTAAQEACGGRRKQRRIGIWCALVSSGSFSRGFGSNMSEVALC